MRRETHLRVFPLMTIALILLLGFGSMNQMVWWQNNRTLFTRALTVTPENPKALDGLASAYIAEGRYSDAVPLLKRALEIKPRDSSAMFAIGRIAWKQGDDATAERFLTQALSIEPRYDMWLHLASVEMHRNNLIAAEQAVREAMAMSPKGVGVHVALGTVLLAKGDRGGRGARVSRGTADVSAERACADGTGAGYCGPVKVRCVSWSLFEILSAMPCYRQVPSEQLCRL